MEEKECVDEKLMSELMKIFSIEEKAFIPHMMIMFRMHLISIYPIGNVLNRKKSFGSSYIHLSNKQRRFNIGLVDRSS